MLELILGALLAGGVGFGLGWWISRRRAGRRELALRREIELAREESRTDPLTGVANRRAWEEHLGQALAIWRRYGAPLSVVLIDLDGMKEINDTWGHVAGDAALRELARQLKSNCRESDLIARYGGDEFVLLLTQTDAAGARTFAERIQTEVARESLIVEDLTLPLRVSIGATTVQVGDLPLDLLRRADAALYASKRAGGNRVTAESPTSG